MEQIRSTMDFPAVEKWVLGEIFDCCVSDHRQAQEPTSKCNDISSQAAAFLPKMEVHPGRMNNHSTLLHDAWTPHPEYAGSNQCQCPDRRFGNDCKGVDFGFAAEHIDANETDRR